MPPKLGEDLVEVFRYSSFHVERLSLVIVVLTMMGGHKIRAEAMIPRDFRERDDN